MSSHRFLIERGRWIKTKIELPNTIIYALCVNIRTFKMVQKCAHFHTLRIKFINKYDYVRPSMYQFQLMNTRKKGNIVD